MGARHLGSDQLSLFSSAKFPRNAIYITFSRFKAGFA